MAIKLSSVRANVRRENEGDWVPIPEWPGVELRVRGFAYGPFQNAKSQLESKWARRNGGRDTVPFEEVYRANGRLYAEYLLLDWKGIDDDAGNPIEYDDALGMQVLTDPAYRDLHDHIRYATNKLSQTEIEFVERASGNLGRSSDGSLNHEAA